MKLSLSLLAVSAAVQDEVQGCRLDDTVIQDNVLDSPSVAATIEICKEACTSHDFCAAFSWDHLNELCHLKQQLYEADGTTPITMATQHNVNYVSAEKNCNLNPIDYSRETECKVSDALITGCIHTGSVTGVSKESCQTSCQSNIDCNFFMVDTNGVCTFCSDGARATITASYKFPVVTHLNVGSVSATKNCDLTHATLTDVLRGEDGITSFSLLDENVHTAVEGDDGLSTYNEEFQTIKFGTHAPTTSPTLSPTFWDINPENYWVPCEISAWRPWTQCTKTCGTGIQKSQSTFTPAHMNTNYRGDDSNIPAEPACNVCTQYSETYPYDCISYDLIPENSQDVTASGRSVSYYVTRFRDCEEVGVGLSPCPIDCRWGNFGDWFSTGDGAGTLRRGRSITVAADFGGQECPGEAFEEKDWQETTGDEAGTKPICVAGTTDGEWGACVSNSNGKSYSKRIKVETICSKKFLALDAADVTPKETHAARDGENPSKIVMTYHQTKECVNSTPSNLHATVMTRAERPGFTTAP